jgi:hypothetical protein
MLHGVLSHKKNKIWVDFDFFWPDMCVVKFPLVSMGAWAEGLACADPGVRAPIGASGNFLQQSLTLWVFHRCYVPCLVKGMVLVDMSQNINHIFGPHCVQCCIAIYLQMYNIVPFTYYCFLMLRKELITWYLLIAAVDSRDKSPSLESRTTWTPVLQWKAESSILDPIVTTMYKEYRW